MSNLTIARLESSLPKSINYTGLEPQETSDNYDPGKISCESAPPIISRPLINIKNIDVPPEPEDGIFASFIIEGKQFYLLKSTVLEQSPEYETLSTSGKILVLNSILYDVINKTDGKLEAFTIYSPYLVFADEVMDILHAKSLIPLTQINKLEKEIMDLPDDDPNKPYYLLVFAKQLYIRGKLSAKRTEKILKKCIELNPNELLFHVNLAQVYFNENKFGKMQVEILNIKAIIDANKTMGLSSETCLIIEELKYFLEIEINAREYAKNESDIRKTARALLLMASAMNPLSATAMIINRVKQGKPATMEEVQEILNETNYISEETQNRMTESCKKASIISPILVVAMQSYDNYYNLQIKIKQMQDGTADEKEIKMLNKEAEKMKKRAQKSMNEALEIACKNNSIDYIDHFLKTFKFMKMIIDKEALLMKKNMIPLPEKGKEDRSQLGIINKIIKETVRAAKIKKDVYALEAIAKNWNFSCLAYEAAIDLTNDKRKLIEMADTIIKLANSYDDENSAAYNYRRAMKNLAISAYEKAGEKVGEIKLNSELAGKKIINIEFIGNEKTKVKKIMKVLESKGGVKAGQGFDPERLDESIGYLASNLRLLNPKGWEIEKTDDGVKIKIEVEDNAKVEYGGGVTFGQDNVNIYALLGLSNIEGTGQSLEGHVGYSKTYKHDNISGELIYTNPDILTYGDRPIGLDAALSRDFKPIYDDEKLSTARVQSARIRLRTYLSKNWSIFLTPAYSESSNLDTKNDFRKYSLTPGVEYNTTDNPEIPTKGTEVVLGLGSGKYNNNDWYFNPNISAKQYFPLPLRTSLALRLNTGLGWNLFEGDRAGLGGPFNMVRGFNQPFSSSNSYSAGGIEFRSPAIKLASSFKCQFFIFGDVGVGYDHYKGAGASTGVGIRFYIPLIKQVEIYYALPDGFGFNLMGGGVW